MLWQKESKKKGGLYVDIFALNGGEALLNEVFRPMRCETKGSTFNKSDVTSLQKRKLGNQQFGEEKWALAMELYNASLRYAENGSKHIGLAYANRSACFMKLKHYNECLIDIELAKAAGYPADLMTKLDKRKEECLSLIKSGVKSASFEPKLSLEPDERFPCMANVLKIDRDDDGDFTVIAKEDIGVGETIVVEKAFITSVFIRNGLKCHICLKESTNLMPCTKCTVAMFCSEQCRDNPLHEHECGLKFSNNTEFNSSIMRNVRSLLLAIGGFTDIDDLIAFVERSLKSDPYATPTVLSDLKSQYTAFLKLPIPSSTSTIAQNLACIVFEVYRILLVIPHVRAMFSSEKSRRFLIHLIAHHYHVLEHNSTLPRVMIQNTAECDQLEPMYLSSQTGLIIRYFKHSCAPNVAVSSQHGNTVVTTVRPIKKGDQVVHSYLMIMTESKEVRQKLLWERKLFICKCSLCTDGHIASKMERSKMASDPDFQYIMSKMLDVNQYYPHLEEITDKCKQFLQKYGHNLWCTELGSMVQTYISLLSIRYRGISNFLSLLNVD